jgi:CRP/FNR family cyclic AMP-dependent transcriptional regulator
MMVLVRKPGRSGELSVPIDQRGRSQAKITLFQRPEKTMICSAAQLKTLEDPLAYLPCSAVLKYSKGQVIYSPLQPTNGLHVVIDGSVKVCRKTDCGKQILLDVYRQDEFFGESTVLGMFSETATAFQNATVMKWTAEEIQQISILRPMLSFALWQWTVQRSMDFGSRIDSLSVDSIDRRLARALIRFSDRLGNHIEDGSVNLTLFTHELLAQYVGTSREIITKSMSAFRELGYLGFSRRGIWLDREAISDWLKSGTTRTRAAISVPGIPVSEYVLVH